MKIDIKKYCTRIYSKVPGLSSVYYTLTFVTGCCPCKVVCFRVSGHTVVLDVFSLLPSDIAKLPSNEQDHQHAFDV